MELKAYGRILWRHRWVVALLFLVVVIASLPGLLADRPAVYQAGMRFAVGVVPEPSTGAYYTYDRYYTWLASEYLVDDLAEVVRSSAFASAVSQRLAMHGIQVPAGAIQGSTQAGKLHRILSLSITWGQEEELRLIANAAVQTLQEESATFLAQLGAENAHVALIDPPVVGMVGSSLRERLDLPIRLFLALVAGVALAFLLDYLDDSIRGCGDLEALGLQTLAEIPRSRRWRLGSWRMLLKLLGESDNR